MMIVHILNWRAGWILLLLAFASGAIIGTRFHGENFLGDYTSFRRRIVRLGHISLAALGMINLLFAATVRGSGLAQQAASMLLILGAGSMAATCFLTGCKPVFRHLFFIPVLTLSVAVILILMGGVS